MYWYEVAYEDGTMSKIMCPSDDVALGALKVQNDRAKNGQPNGPQGGTAVRVARVYRYDDDPGSFGADGGMSADVLLKEVAALVASMSDKNGVVHLGAFATAVRGLGSPMQATTHPHDSRYKMSGTELPLDALEA
jgi:hypothetical protein